MYVRKKSFPVQAFRLGEQTEQEQQLRLRNQLLQDADGLWRLRNLEAPEEGELVSMGDYIKLDTEGRPYPNKKDWFEANHTHIEGNWYRQIPVTKTAWCTTEPLCPQMQFLLDRGLLTWRKDDVDQTFSALLWGTRQSAPEDAVILFDRIEYADHTLQAVEFHFIAREEFLKTYDVLPPPNVP